MTQATVSNPSRTSAFLLPAAVIIFGSLILLFARLGHYAPWDDEAITAMTARAVAQTGDTSARVDARNLLVYRNGLLVRNFADRYTPPLQFYLIAFFIRLFGGGNFAIRLPVALCGVITVCLMIAWLRRANASRFLWWAAAAILLTNAEFFLFFRNCRYYGLAMMLTTAVAFFYCNRDGKLRWSIGLSIALAALLASQYLDYAAVVGCLVVDYILWGRNRPISLLGWASILLPQLIVGGVLICIWNLALLHPQVYLTAIPRSWIHDRLCLWWWHFRDPFVCDFGILPLILICPLLYLKNRSLWLLRAPMALVTFLTAMAFAVPTSMAAANCAEVRYLAPAIPLCIAVSILAVWGLLSLNPILRWMMLVFAAASVLIEYVPEKSVPWYMHSTAILFYHELAVPQTESYTPVINWINENVPAGSTILIEPGYKNYPLMLRAGKAIYAWQLDDTQEIFTPKSPTEGEIPTLEIPNTPGETISVSITNPKNPTQQSVSDALVAAWNADPDASLIATAKVGSPTNPTIILLPSNRTIPNVVASVQHAKTGKLTKEIIPPRADFKDVPDIHFFGRVAPDYMIRFGSNSESGDFDVAEQLLASRGIEYELVKTIHLHWKDYYRPERLWHSFVTVDPDEGDEIHIYRKEH
jgi:4-amino-4-deoxy-L-arabinose transferase-like glycosyltransferase